MERNIHDYFETETMPEKLACRIEESLRTNRKPAIIPHRMRMSAVAASLAAMLVLFNISAVQSFAENVISQFFHEPQGRLGSSFAEVRDGQLFFTGNGEDMDITDLCSEYTPFIYVSETPTGKTIYMIIGGTPDNWGYMEFLYSPINGGFTGSGHNTCDPDNNYESYSWVKSALEQLNLPYRP